MQLGNDFTEKVPCEGLEPPTKSITFILLAATSPPLLYHIIAGEAKFLACFIKRQINKIGAILLQDYHRTPSFLPPLPDYNGTTFLRELCYL